MYIQYWQVKKRYKEKTKKAEDKETKNNHGVLGWLFGKLLESQIPILNTQSASFRWFLLCTFILLVQDSFKNICRYSHGEISLKVYTK